MRTSYIHIVPLIYFSHEITDNGQNRNIVGVKENKVRDKESVRKVFKETDMETLRRLIWSHGWSKTSR